MRAGWFLLGLLLVALDVYLLAYRWSDVGGNIEAQFIIITPAVVTQHLLMRRHVDRRNAEVHARLDAQDAALNVPPSDDPAA